MQILQKPTKSKNECDFLLKSIQGLHLFQKNKDMLRMKDCNQPLLEKLRLEYFPARKTVFNYGDFGYTYYIVLQGECDLLIPAPTTDCGDKSKKDESGNNKSENKEQILQQQKSQEFYNKNQNSEVEITTDLKESQTVSQALNKLGKKKIKLDSKWKVLKQTFNPDQENMNLQEISSPRQNLDDDAYKDNESQEQFLERCFTGLKLMKTFKPGEAFGEIALMTKQRRTGTIVCRENTFLMALTKESFDIILGAYHEIIIQRKLNFLKSYNFFRGVPNSKLLSLLHMMKIVNYNNKNIIYTEKDPSRFVYLIREGEVEISQICNIESNIEKEKKKKEEQEDNPNDINAVKAQKEIRNKKKRIRIVIKGKNSYFGEEEILKHVDRRKQQAICNSETAEIFLIKKDILYNYTRGYGVIDRLKEEFKVKGEWNQIRQAQIVQTTQNTKIDIEKQITLLSLKKSATTIANLNENKILENKSQAANIFSVNQGKSQTFLNIPQNPASMTSINSSGNKRNSLMNTFNNNPRTPSQSSGLTIDPFDIKSSKQRLSLRTNPFNPNSLNTIQKQLELASNKQINFNQGTVNDENSDAFFATGVVGQFSTNINLNIKNTPEQKIQLKLNHNKKNSQQTTLYGIENQFQTPQSTHKIPTTITEEENYIENKILNNKMRRYLGEQQKSKEQLAQVAIEQFGDMSHNAFVNKVGQTIEYKMQILKKLNQNGLQSPKNVFADLYEEFGLKKKSNFKVRKSFASSSNQGSQKDLNIKSQSTINGQDFQKKILLERKNQIRENIKKQNTLNYIDDTSLITCGTLQDHNSRGKTFHSQQQNSMQEITSPEYFTRNKVRASTTINFNTYNYQSSSSQDSRRISDRQKSFDEINLSGYESQVSSSQSITLPKRNSFAEKFKNAPQIQVKNLDVLEEVSENNSPVKINQGQIKKRNSTVNEIKSGSQIEYGLTKQQLLQLQFMQQKINNRMSLESVNSNNDSNPSQYFSSKSQVFLNPSKQVLTNSSNFNTGSNQSQISDSSQLTNSNHTNLYNGKSFLNRNTTSLKKKQEARRAISRNSSSNSKENSLRIGVKQNNFFSLHKTMQYCQSQGSISHQNSTLI